MSTQRRKLYSSSNGDGWYLCRGRDGKIVVLHEAKQASGSHAEQVEVGEFLSSGNGPEHQALFQLIGELIDPSHIPNKRQLDQDKTPAEE